MTRLSKLSDHFKGPALKDKLYNIVLVSNGSHDIKDYVDIDNSLDTIFYIVKHKVNGVDTMVISSHTDHILSSEYENTEGIAYFVKNDDFTLRSIDTDAIIKLGHNHLSKMYIGQKHSLKGDNNLLIFKNNTSTDAPVPSAIDDTNKTTLRSLAYEGTTTTETLLLDDLTLSIGNFTSTQNINLIPKTGILTIYEGVYQEFIKYSHYDPVSNKIRFEKRGYMDSVAKAWIGTFKIAIWNQTHIDNHDHLSANIDLVSAFDVFLVPQSKDCYLRSYMTLNRMYDYDNYTGATQVRSYKTGKSTYRHDYIVDMYLFLNDIYPASLTSDRVNGKYVKKGSNQYTDIIFSHPHEADQGYIYDYCDINETCGTCMGNTPDDSDNCMVNSTAYNIGSDQDPLTYGPNYGSEHKNWNQYNKTMNHWLPIYLAAVSGAFMIITFIAYVIRMSNFTHTVGRGTYTHLDHDFTDELSESKRVMIGAGIFSVLIFAVTAGLGAYSVVEGKKSSGKRIFPAINYDRSIYNPPPGYTFVNAPSSKN
jgi:hypothetical protein